MPVDLDPRHFTGLLEGNKQGLMCTGQGKAVTSQEPGPDLPSGFGVPPGVKDLQGMAVAHCGDKNNGGSSTGEYSLM